MSREVEVQNIKMTATVPENIQLSLGKLSTTEGSKTGLSTNNGVLVGSSGNADNGSVDAPDNVEEYWSNTADVSNYYQLGRIIPASSTTGLNIYYTPDSDGVGKTLKADAKYYTAATAGTPANDASGGTNMRTTLHAFTTEHGTSDTWYTAGGAGNYTTASAHNQTNDDGYYVDIPIWLRTSSTAGANLSVDAYVTTDTTEDDDLYLAARAVILNTGRTAVQGDGLIEVRKDGWSGTSVVDYMYTTNSTGEPVQSQTSNAATYADATRYDGDDVVVALTGPSGDGQRYGTAVQVWVHVWLEGEDPNCCNDNAGQNFNICLKFVNGETTTADANPYTDNTTAVRNGDTTTVSFMGASTAAFNTMTFAYNGTTNKWEVASGVFNKPVNVSFALGSSAVTDVDGIITYLNNNCDTKSEASNGYEVIATGETVQFTGTKAQATVWADAIPTGATNLKVAGADAASVDAMKTAIAGASEPVTVSYVAPVPVGS